MPSSNTNTSKRPWWLRLLFVLVVAMLCGRVFIELVDGATAHDMGNAIATCIVVAIIVAGFVFFRRYFREFDMSQVSEPPLGWSPTLTEEAVPPARAMPAGRAMV